MRETRDLLRRRNYFVRQRSGLFTHLQILNAQYNLPPFPKRLAYASNRQELDIANRFADPSVQRSAAVDLAVIDVLEEHIDFVLGHALYMKAIHGGKAKNDRIDAGKIARLLRGGTFPLAYAYPKGMRETRDLLRRRTHLVRRRAELLTHLQILNSQYNLAPFPKRLSFAANRAEMDIAHRFADPSVQRNAAADLAVIDALDVQIAELELYLTRTAKVDDVQTFYRLRSIPGVGKVLALTLLYELHDIGRFDQVGQFLSYARLVRCAHESAGKKKGTGGKKIGNAHLRWAFGEAACLFLRGSERAKRWKQKQQAQRGEAKALAILAARLGRAVYHMLRKREAFDEARFWQGGGRRGATGSSSLSREEACHAGD